jgi:hypothetical protein
MLPGLLEVQDDTDLRGAENQALPLGSRASTSTA